jgi:RND family efflux transporter MFP subunit
MNRSESSLAASPHRLAEPRAGQLGRRLVTLLVALAFTAGVTGMLLQLSGLFKEKVPPAGGAAAVGRELPADAEVVAVRRISRPRYESAVGTVKPAHEVGVASKILAVIEQVRVTAGQAVRTGQMLVVLDDAALAARMAQAKAAAEAAGAAAERARQDLGRAERLRAQNVVTQAELDAARAAAKSTEADRMRAVQAVEEARVMLSYAQLASPIDGIVVDKRADAGDTAVPGQVLVTLYDPSHMQMVASVREGLATKLTVGQEVPATLENLGLECHATVSEIVPESQAASRSFLVKVTGPCPPGVTSGMFGRIAVPLEDESLLVVPQRAIRRVGQLTMVDLVRDSRTVRRAVRLGREIDGDWEVLAGLADGDRVALRPRHSGAASPADGASGT